LADADVQDRFHLLAEQIRGSILLDVGETVEDLSKNQMRHAVTVVGGWPFDKVDSKLTGILLAAVLGLCGQIASAKGLYDDLDKLSEELRAPEAVRRREAVDKLDAFDGNQTQKLLTELLSDGDPEVKARAAVSVGRHRLLSMTPALISALGDSEPRVRAAAAEGLGLLGDAMGERSERALERRLGDTEPEVRSAVLVALGRLSLQLVGRAMPAVAARLDDDHASVRVRAAEVLGRLGDKRAVMPLIGRLQDSSREVRSLVIDALVRIGDEKASSAVGRLLRDPIPEVALRALDALGQLGGPTAAPLLLETWEHGSSDAVRAHAAMGLGRLVAAAPNDSELAPKALSSLIGGIGRDPLAVKEALWLCGKRATPVVAARIPVAAGDELALLIDLAKELADVRLGPVLLDELSRGRAPRDKVVDALGAILRAGDKSMLAPLLALMGRPDPSLRRRVLLAIAGHADARGNAVLADAAADADREVRLLAIAELGRLGVPSPSLAKALGSSDGDTATAAARALGTLGNAAEADALVAALDRDPPSLRREAADALAQIVALHPALSSRLGPELLRRVRASNERRPDVLAAVAGVYRGRPDAVAREVLLGLAESDSESIEAPLAVAALGAMGDAAAASRLQRLLSRPAPLRRRVIAALGDLRAPLDGDRRAALLGQLGNDDPAAQAEAAWAFGKHPEVPASIIDPPLRRALGSSSALLRANASGALVRLGRLSPVEAERLTSDAEPAVRANAFVALRPSSPERLGRLRADADAFVRALASLPATHAARRDFVVLHVLQIDGSSFAEAPVRLQFPDGIVKRTSSDLAGDVREEGVPSGACQVELAE